jgi:hypothetical protein
MPTLIEILCSSAQKPAVVRDATNLVDDEVRSKGGLSGMAIKTAYKTVSRLKPGLVHDVIDGLLEKFVERLEPIYNEWDEGGRSGSFGSYISARSNKAANALLGVTDERARVVSNKVLKKAYNSIRPQGEKNVEQAIPGLGRLIDRYIT